MTRVVMPLLYFVNASDEEFDFGQGYSLRRFRPGADIPSDCPLLSKKASKELQLWEWALVAQDPDRAAYREDINRLLLSFKIYTLGRLRIKYRLCASDASLCSIIEQQMTYILMEKSPSEVSLSQLGQVKTGFERLQEMDVIKAVSNRTHNAIFFMYCAYFSTGHAMSLFQLLFTVLEALFSKETRGGATRTVCERASAFLGSRSHCTYSDIERLYNIRSELVHGKRNATAGGENLADAHELEFVVTECMKKMLDERTYLKYEDLSVKEQYLNQLVARSVIAPPPQTR